MCVCVCVCVRVQFVRDMLHVLCVDAAGEGKKREKFDGQRSSVLLAKNAIRVSIRGKGRTNGMHILFCLCCLWNFIFFVCTPPLEML